MAPRHALRAALRQLTRVLEPGEPLADDKHGRGHAITQAGQDLEAVVETEAVLVGQGARHRRQPAGLSPQRFAPRSEESQRKDPASTVRRCTGFEKPLIRSQTLSF